MKRSRRPAGGAGAARRRPPAVAALLGATALAAGLLGTGAEVREPARRPVPVVLSAPAGEPGASPSAPAASPSATAWAWPISGQRTVGRRFDPPTTRYGAGHRGVDLVTAPGAPVLAAGPGQVTYAGLLAGRGVVVVDHGSLRTTYEPVAASVQVGAQVARGTAIGSLEPGHEGCPQAGCLHWGLRRGDSYLDPLSVVDAGPVRLLPLDPAPAAPASGSPAVGSRGWDGAADPPPSGAGGAAAEPAAARPTEPRPALRLTGAATSSALAALALLAALLALRRAGGRPDPGGGAAAAVPVPVTANPPVDLATERDRRRRAASAASEPAAARRPG